MCRLVKEGLCDKTTAPSVSAISRLLRGRDEDEPVKKKEDEEQGECFNRLSRLHTTFLTRGSLYLPVDNSGYPVLFIRIYASETLQ